MTSAAPPPAPAGRGLFGSRILWEVAGSLGDLPIFITFLIGFVALCGLDPAPVLVWTGVASIAAGAIFRIPIAVQPMKAIGALALASGFGAGDIITTGILMGAILVACSGFGLFSRLYSVVPIGVVRGIQAGLGTMLIIRGLGLAAGGGAWFGTDGHLVSATLLLLCLTLFFHRSFPVSLLIVGLGSLAAFAGGLPIEAALYRPELRLTVSSCDPAAVASMLLAQFPLTLTNSLLATVLLAEDLYGRKIRIDGLAAHVGMMNLLFCPFGAMPMCHGAGGMAAQSRFGGRTGWTTAAAGAAKLAAGLLFGPMVLAFISAFPLNLLGVMLSVGGMELIIQGLRVRGPSQAAVMLVTASVSVGTNTGLGFMVGWTAWAIMRAMQRPALEDDTS